MKITPIVEADMTPDTAVDDRSRLFGNERDFVVIDPAFGDSVLLIRLKSEKEAGRDQGITPLPSHSQ